MRRILPVLLALFAVSTLLLAASCGSGSEATRIRIGTSSITPLHAALGEILRETDILAQHGLQGEFLAFERGKDQHEKCSSGLVDATFSCEVAAMVHLQQLPGTVITGSPGALGDTALVVPTGSPVQGVAHLRGRSVAVLQGASSELLLRQWAALEPGLFESLRVERHGGRGEGALRALRAGQVDALVLWDPWLTQSMSGGGLRVVERAPFWSVTIEYRDRLDDDTWSRYHAALADALAWAAADPDRAAELAAARGDLPVDLVRSVLLSNDYVSGQATPSLVPVDAHSDRLAACDAFARQLGMVPPDFRLVDRMRLAP